MSYFDETEQPQLALVVENGIVASKPLEDALNAGQDVLTILFAGDDESLEMTIAEWQASITDSSMMYPEEITEEVE